MRKISETGVEKYTEEIGNSGLVMNIRVETTADGKKVNAPVKRADKTVACLTRETDKSVFLSINSDANLSAEEFSSLFSKSVSVLNELASVTVEPEEDDNEEDENQEQE